MTLLRRLQSIVRWIVHRDRAEQDLHDELKSFAEMAADAERRDGATPAEAERLAALTLGGLEQTRERVRSGRHGAWLDAFGGDVRYGLRQVGRNRAFSAVAIATLALGIGGVTAMFSAFDAVLVRPLPYADADRLVMVWDAMSTNDVRTKHDATPAEWIAWRRLNSVFTDLAATPRADITISGDGEPEQLPGQTVTWTFWNVLGVQPIRGRVFTEDEDNNGVRVVVISYGLWQRRFGGDAQVIGRTISLNDQPYEVIGVMPRNFYFLPSRDIDLWRPSSFPAWMRTLPSAWHSSQIVARLKPDAALSQARESMAALSLQLTAKDDRGPHPVIITPLREEMAGRSQAAVSVLLGASVTLLLIACVNLTNLLLSRGAARGREIAMRMALGAPRSRIVSQLLTESLILAGLGMIAGLALAQPAMRFLEQLIPDAMGTGHLTLHWRVLIFSAAVAVATAVIFGLAPAWRGSQLAPHDALRDGGRGTSGGRSHWFQHSLIVVETALAVMLLTCGGLLVQTYQHLRNTDIGFSSEQLLTFETPLFRYAKDFDRRVAFFNAEVDQVRAIPGVVSAGSVDVMPFTNTANATFYLFEGQPGGQAAGQVALIRNVSRDYFSTIGAELREGRHFSASDQRSSLPVAIVNETFAKRNFAGRSPLGQRFKFGSLGPKGYWYTIVGVVKAIPETGVLDEARPAVYRVHEQCDQIGSLNATIVVRTAVDPNSIIPAVRQAIWSLDKNQPIARIRTMEEVIGRQLSTSSQSTSLLVAFAVLALLLASIGLYGVIAYAVTQRTNEIGLRMALGARAGEIVLSLSRRGLALTMCGLAIGLVAAAIASRWLTTLFYGFQPDYVATIAAVSLLLASVAALACVAPARRAARIDPMIALRHE
jgi:putative ABC transport system permease protein